MTCTDEFFQDDLPLAPDDEQEIRTELARVLQDYPHFGKVFLERMASGAVVGNRYTGIDNANLPVGCFYGWLSGYTTGEWAGRLSTIEAMDLCELYQGLPTGRCLTYSVG